VFYAEENPYIIPLIPAYHYTMNDGRLCWDGRDSIATFHRGESCCLVFIDGHVTRYLYHSDWQKSFDRRVYDK
jgi:hypothetical protein